MTEDPRDLRIQDLERMLAESQEAHTIAVNAGNAFKAANDEAAERVEKAERRIYELEKNRELFQQQRDDAIKERDEARLLRDRVMKTQPCKVEAEKLRLQPGELVIVRFKEAPKESEWAETWKRGMDWLRKQYPQNTFIVLAHDVKFGMQVMGETELRKHGLISAARVDAGVQQLEAAFGAQQAALKEARKFLGWIIEGKEDLKGIDKGIADLVEQLDKILKAELIPEPKPTREDLLALVREMRPLLVWNTCGDTTEDEETKDLDQRLESILGPEVDELEAGGQR